jgi:isopenicillin N synthase-like dioxygenase
MSIIPTVDLAGSFGDAARAIDRACRDVGFFQVIGHGVDPTIEHDAWQLVGAFFELPIDSKMVLAIPAGDAYGYGPYQAERLAASLGAATPPDLKETFSVGPPEAPTVPLHDPAAAFVYSPNRWPVGLPALEPALMAYYGELSALADRVMSLMAAGLNLPIDYFVPYINRHTSALRALRYPDLGGVQPEPGQLRAGAHSDYGTLTLLRQDDAPGGLEVRGVDGGWHLVPPVPDAYVVNVGDALERWTNDQWRSTVHRVVVPEADVGRDCTRQSLAFFHNANWDAVIECLPTCLAPDGTAKYAPVTAGHHLMSKFRSTQSY